MVTVSVIIPTYNRADLISDAIDSVLNQTYSDYEIIVVDDASTDNTAEVVNRYGDRVHYEVHAHSGASGTRNHGLRAAHGRYIAFLDSDDLFFSTKLEKQIALFEQHPELGMVYSSYTSANLEKKPLDEHPAGVYKNGYQELLTGCTIATPTVMVRRDVIDQIGMFDEELLIADDIDLWSRIFRYYPIEPIHESLALVRLHEGSMGRDPEWILNSYMHLLLKAFRADPSISWFTRRRMLARMHYICAAEVRARVDPKSTDPNKYATWEFYFVKAARYYPFSRLGMTVLRDYYMGRIHVSLEPFLKAFQGTSKIDKPSIEDMKVQAFAHLSSTDLRSVVMWMKENVEFGEAQKIFSEYGFELSKTPSEKGAE